MSWSRAASIAGPVPCLRMRNTSCKIDVIEGIRFRSPPRIRGSGRSGWRNRSNRITALLSPTACHLPGNTPGAGLLQCSEG